MVRFKGFTSDWEQRKLSELAIFSKGIGYSKSDLRESGTPIILYGRLYTKYETVIKDVDTFVEDKTDSIYSKGGEVIVPASGETAEDISIASVVEKPGILLGSDLNIIHPNKKIDSTFLAISISNGEPHLDMARRAQGKSIVHLHNDDLAQIGLSYPILEEQRKISRCFSQLDHLITLHQRKSDQLKKLKAYFLQNLFPDKGEKVPKIRFKGFTDDWEQRKLGSIAIINPKSELPEQFKYVDLESVVGTSLLGYSVVERENAPSRAQRLAIEGDVFYQTVRPYQRNNYLYEETDKDYVFSTGYAQLRTSLDSYFLLTLLQNDNFVKIVLDNCTGTSYPAINSSALSKIPVSTPKSIDETIKIGNTFRKLDNFITLHQRKLEALQTLKKFLLQNLFV